MYTLIGTHGESNPDLSQAQMVTDMAQIGNKANATLNRELGKHHTSRFGRSRNRFYRRLTSKRRRLAGKRVIAQDITQAA